MGKFRIGTKVNIVRGNMKNLSGVITESYDMTTTYYRVKIDDKEERVFSEHNLEFEDIMDMPLSESYDYQMYEGEMKNMSDELKMLYERVDMLKDEIDKVERAIVSIQNGVPFTEAFNEEVYLEAKQEQKQSYSALMRMIEHLLKIKYCTNNRNYDHWCGEIENHRKEVFKHTLCGTDDEDKNLVKYINSKIQKIYEAGIKEYKKDAQKYSDLIDISRLIAKECPECPWDLEQLMDDDIEDLLARLPDME